MLPTAGAQRVLHLLAAGNRVGDRGVRVRRSASVGDWSDVGTGGAFPNRLQWVKCGSALTPGIVPGAQCRGRSSHKATVPSGPDGRPRCILVQVPHPRAPS